RPLAPTATQTLTGARWRGAVTLTPPARACPNVSRRSASPSPWQPHEYLVLPECLRCQGLSSLGKQAVCSGSLLLTRTTASLFSTTPTKEGRGLETRPRKRAMGTSKASCR
ncbi:hypothetical protein FHG87_025321, partial [Trinorchestia longiramus]